MKFLAPVLTLALLALAGPTAPAEPKKPTKPKKSQGIKGRRDNQERKAGLPDCQWYTAVLDKNFQIVATRFDKKTSTVIWTLKAKGDVKTRGYTALFEDADGVAQGTVAVRLSPGRFRYRKEAVVKASFRFPRDCEVTKVTIRERK
jgi:hypothetical protein